METAKTKIEHLQEIIQHYEGWTVSRGMAIKELQKGDKPKTEKERLLKLYNENIADYQAKIEAVKEAIKEMSHAEV